MTSICNNANMCNSTVSAVCSNTQCHGQLFNYAGKLTSLPLHSTERAHNFDQAFITKPNYPQSTILVWEGCRLLCVEAQVGVCHCLSHYIIETQNSKDMSNYLAMCKYIIKFLTESTHFGSNLDEILGYRIRLCTTGPRRHEEPQPWQQCRLLSKWGGLLLVEAPDQILQAN